jgi:hypothetical protein
MAAARLPDVRQAEGGRYRRAGLIAAGMC